MVVSHNGRPFLRETFRGLAAQSRAIDDILVVDTGSTDGSADWARSRLGEDAVVAVRGQFGRAVMAALRDSRTAGTDWLWLLHDDVAPEPEALERLLAEAESRPSASILGPKLVSWTNPDRLQEIGWSVDRTGRAVSPIEDDEIDQGQHDQIRDVFYVSTAGMLVRRSTLVGVGGFDERMTAFRDDLDLCWRTHLTGGRVLVVPSARVRHFGAASSRTRRTRAVNHPRYLAERHTLAALLKATALRRLPLVLAMALVGGGLRALALALTGRPADALQILGAWGWNIKELPVTVVQRRRLQHRRKIPDTALAPLRAAGGQPLRAMLRGLLDLVYGEVGEHVAQVSSNPDEQDLQQQGNTLGKIVASHPVAFTVIGFAVLLALSLRGLLFAPGIAGGALGLFPDSGQTLLREFLAAFHQNGLGSTAAAPPNFAVLGALATLTFNKALLAEKLLLWLALPVAAATCTRALRVLVDSRPARALAGLLYASSPLAFGAIAQGRLGELLFLVLAPPTLAQLPLVFRPDQPRESWRPALRFMVLAAASIVLYPPAFVVLALVVAVAVVAALARPARGLGRFAVKQAVFLAAAMGGTLVLLAPWSSELLAGLLRGDRPAAAPNLLDLLQLRPGGPGVPGHLVGPVYPALALAAIPLVLPTRRLQAFWLVAGFVGAAVVAAWEAHGLAPLFTDWPGGVLVVGAVAWAAAAGMALGRLRELWEQASSLDPRRVGAGALALLTLLTGLLVTVQFVRGSWAPLQAVGRPSLPATVRQSSARVLWLAGRPDHGVNFAVTGSDGRTLLDDGQVASGNAAGALRSVVTDVVEARTHAAGRLLQLFGIGYVVVRHGPEEERLTGLVSRQQDLRARPTEQAELFQGPTVSASIPSVAPAGWLITSDTLPGSVQGMLTGPLIVGLQAAQPLLSGPDAKLPAHVISDLPALPGGGPATIVLPVPADSAWQATVGGTRLRAGVAFGWAQAFRLPEGASGTLDLRRTGQTSREALLLAEGLLVLVALAAMARPTRVAPPVAPSTVDETTGEFRLNTRIREGAR
ncbi:MAG TPA: glycosyltransferase family 2 protein [Actinomycetota bacterium]